MTGVKPKILCGQCGAELKKDYETCPSCGGTIDWSDEFVFHAKEQARKNNQSRRESLKAVASRSVIGWIIVVAMTIIAYEIIQHSASSLIRQTSIKQEESKNAQTVVEIQELEKKVNANPGDMMQTLQLANLLQDHSFYEKAIRYYKIYLEENPTDADARVDMGICYKELNNLTDAEMEMKKALVSAPKHVNAHFNLGIVYRSEGKYQESNEWFKKTVALNPNSEVGRRAQQLLTQNKSQHLGTQ